jgi:hypothetical protein
MATQTIKPAIPRSPLVHSKINKTPVNTDSIESLTKATDRAVVGTFVNIECPGQPAKICCKYYKEQEFYSKTFEDGQKYTVPLSVARHINERCFYEPHTYLQDEKGNPLKSGKKLPRYKFTPEF